MRTQELATGATTTALTFVLLGLAGCSTEDGGDHPPSTSGGSGLTTPSTTGAADEWTLGLDSQPTRAAVVDDRVFVSTAGGTRFPPQVVAIDPATGRAVEKRTATGQPFDLLVAPDGRLWAAGDRHPDQAGGAGINVYDPASLVAVAHADLPGAAYSLALVGDEIWVGSDGTIFGLDASTLELIRTVQIIGPAYQLVVLPSADGVIAVEGDRLELLGLDGVTTGGQAVTADGSVVTAATAAALFVRVPVDADSTLLTLDPGLTAPGRPVGVDTDSSGGGLLATAAGDVILVDDRRDEVLCLPGGAPPVVRLPADDLVGVLAELPDGLVLFATTSGVTARIITC